MNLLLLLPRAALGTLDVALTFAAAFVAPDGGQRASRRNAQRALASAYFRTHLNIEAARSMTAMSATAPTAAPEHHVA